MKILQLDVNEISFVAIAPEAKTYQKTDDKSMTVCDALVLFTCVETGDTEELASTAIKEAAEFATRQKIGKLMIYPFAHISNNLEKPDRAMKLFLYMVNEAKKSKLEVFSAPFGWNKSLKLDIKGHPMAEMARSYGISARDKKEGKKEANVERKVDLSIVKKSDFAGLPETDHRVIGERLNLFSFQEVSPGMVYWHPNGYTIYKELLKLEREMLLQYGYDEIATPTLANIALWHVSGHIDHYRENMFMFDSADQEQLGMKPMNCPSTILIFKSRKWSYRELPVRLAIFDRLYRNEISGALTGLFRVRELTQDDAHLFIREDQIEQELTSTLRFLNELYGKFKFEYEAKLSTMPDSHLGDEVMWDKATNALRGALNANGMKYVVKDREGAFYGPKIDFDIKDSMGRKWQCATVQMDYQLPQRFGLEYTGEDGKEHTPVMVHRALLGSLERFIGIITEHYQGKFPTWLAPVQVKIITISEQANQYAEGVYKKLREAKVRVELDVSDRTLDYKIREGQMEKVPYMIVLGKKEVEADKISVRGRDGKQKMGVALTTFEKHLKDEIEHREDKQFV